MTKIEVRTATSSDVAGIAAVLESSQLFPAEMLDAMIQPYLQDAACRHIWFVALRGTSVLGFGYCEPERMTSGTWNLLAIAVAREVQGTGNGAQMMSWIEAHLRARGQRLLLVETSGTAAFALTRKFYAKIGYIAEARIRDFYEPGADKIVFWRDLAPALG